MSWLPFPVFVVAMNVFAIVLRDEKEKGWILSVGMGLFCNWDMAKYILPSLGLILLAELVMCIGSEMRSALFLLIAQGSEWPEGLMSVDMQSISLDIVIYNDTAMYLFGQHELMTQCAKYGIPTAVPQTNFGNGSAKAEMKSFLVSICFILL